MEYIFADSLEKFARPTVSGGCKVYVRALEVVEDDASYDAVLAVDTEAGVGRAERHAYGLGDE